MAPADVEVGSSGEIFVKDAARKIIIFRRDGAWDRTIPLDLWLQSFHFGATGESTAIVEVHESGTASLRTVVALDSDFRVRRTLLSEPSWLGSFDDAGSRITVETGFEQGLVMTEIRDGFAAGNSSEYSLIVMDGRGVVRRRIFKDARPAPIPEEARRKYRRLSLPSHAPFFHELLGDDRGNIYVVLTPLDTAEEQTATIDVFDAAGRYVLQLETPGWPCAIREGCLFTLEIDAEGTETVRKYRIENWTDVPSRITSS